MTTGKLIVIEGTDGSGKSTQSKRLLQHLEDSGIITAYADFPQHGQKSAGLVDNYLNGKYGTSDQVDPKIASMFYAADRYDASFAIRKSLDEGRMVVCNRYASSNMGHQAGKISDPQQRKDFIVWLEELEYDFFKIPKPDLTILLYVPYLIAQKMVDSKGKREYINEKRDIHEADAEHLRKAQGAYLEIAREKGWTVINCTKDGVILPIEQIHAMAWEEVNRLLANNHTLPKPQL